MDKASFVKNLPAISVVIPTLNSSRTLADCLKSIVAQDYSLDRLEVIIADGGSTDSTLNIIKEISSGSPVRFKVVENRLKTGEAGKAAGLKHATGELVALIDSDNILPIKDWMQRMVEPFTEPEVLASEPIEYTYREEDGLITRYCALIGMNDPLCLFLGNYDRYSFITNRWTDMPHRSSDRGGYLLVELDNKLIPTIGANGTFIRRSVLEMTSIGDYLFDIDFIYEVLDRAMPQKVKFAKVKTGIIHVFSGDLMTFARKQRRRVRDYLYYNRLGVRKYPWNRHRHRGLVKFILSCVTVMPLIAQSIIGYIKKPDGAWFFHAIACWITLYEYGLGVVSGTFGSSELSREGWKQ